MNSVVLISFVLAATVGVIFASPIDNPKPFNCPPNEKYYKCSLEVCYKTCDHLVKSPPCPLIDSACFKPSCECEDGYLRDPTGTCVTVEECETQNS